MDSKKLSGFCPFLVTIVHSYLNRLYKTLAEITVITLRHLMSGPLPVLLDGRAAMENGQWWPGMDGWKSLLYKCGTGIKVINPLD